MGISNPRPAVGANKNRKRVGRGEGSGHGKTSTRGSNGAGSRSGNKYRAGFEGGQMPLARRLPKFGFHSPFRTEYQILNVDALEMCIANGRLPQGQTITPDTLWEAGLINRQGMPVKILGNGELSQKLNVQAHKISKSAIEKIEKAGGTAEQLLATSVKSNA
ncbi:MAG: 50S ribosomal protein L15 [Bacteroidota bacterium]|nr:50S ribosomal protein L15 [Bacteroidota bacterium]MDP4234752.1 50S ribosomal protein L15 [Bacteroidota bacterium]MDP4242644.1 50S ribosomal protein L15 [Bacteroidota bacterium]MDP4286794.1 50S ribosomal protein L15 [Bacteroidota bacterium]